MSARRLEGITVDVGIKSVAWHQNVTMSSHISLLKRELQYWAAHVFKLSALTTPNAKGPQNPSPSFNRTTEGDLQTSKTWRKGFSELLENNVHDMGCRSRQQRGSGLPPTQNGAPKENQKHS